MSSYLCSLEVTLAAMEQEIQNLPRELDSAVARLDRAKLRHLGARLNRDLSMLLDRLSVLERSMVYGCPIVFDSGSSPCIRQVTSEDLVRWREAHKAEVWVVIGKGSVAVMAHPEVAGENKVTVPEGINDVRQQGYLVLRWEHYQVLLDEIYGLMGEDVERSAASLTERVVIGIPVETTGSCREANVVPPNR
jgi:hypothetical protein